MIKYTFFERSNIQLNDIFTAADVNAWRLGRIEEADHETPV